MREQGVGIKKIASELHVGVGTVYKVINVPKTEAEVITQVCDAGGELDYASFN
jgi:DNA invertase Pin-like site-specific DNA recombinase